MINIARVTGNFCKYLIKWIERIQRKICIAHKVVSNVRLEPTTLNALGDFEIVA